MRLSSVLIRNFIERANRNACSKIYVFCVLSVILPVQLAGFNVLAIQKLSDPTKPGNVQESLYIAKDSSQPAYSLTAIFTRQQTRYAIIDGKVLQTGDMVADMQVREIKSTGVVLRDPSDAKMQIALELLGIVDVKKQVKK